MVDSTYWKVRYRDKRQSSEARERRVMTFIQELTGREVRPIGLGALSSDYL
jgi:hypothetical protein